MTSRSYIVQSAFLEKIKECDVEGMSRDETIDWEIIHMVSSARTAYMLAEKRDVDPDIAACACTIHDIGRVVTGVQKGHAECGYEFAKDFLEILKLFSDEEIEQIAISVKNHSKKGEIGSPLEEIVKDADMLDMHMYGRELQREEQKQRLAKLLTVLSEY